jgi:hypothetical protein
MPIITPLDELEAIYGLPAETAGWRDGRDKPDLGRSLGRGDRFSRSSLLHRCKQER